MEEEWKSRNEINSFPSGLNGYELRTAKIHR